VLTAVSGVELALFALFAAALGWYFAGYLLGLTAIRVLRPRAVHLVVPAPDDPDLPETTVLIPVFNEAALIEDKLADVLALRYPRHRRRIVVVDGGSTDGTGERVAALRGRRGDDAGVVWRSTRATGKIAQLNVALADVPAGHLVVVTDADARILAPDALLRVVGYLRSNPGVGVVGGWVTPPLRRGLIGHAEQAYWDKLNRLRYTEMLAFSASIVVAPFYALFRADLTGFPDDCIADDVYVSFAAHTRGRRVVYAPDIPVIELRQPRGLGQLYRHKRRKAHAYALELLRVAHKLPAMGKRLKFFYAHKLFEFFYLPWAALGFAVLALHLLSAGAVGVVAATGGVLLVSMVLASLSVTPPPGRTRGGLALVSVAASTVTFAVMFVVLMANFFAFPFRRDDSSYARLASSDSPEPP